MKSAANRLARAVWTSFGGQEGASALSFTGDGDLASAYAVTDFASAAIAVAALALHKQSQAGQSGTLRRQSLQRVDVLLR